MCRELKSSLDNYFAFTYGGQSNSVDVCSIMRAFIIYAADSIPMPLIYLIVTYVIVN